MRENAGRSSALELSAAVDRLYGGPVAEEGAKALPLKELLGEIHSGAMALPDFQGPYVWGPEATRRLLGSIARKNPAGMIVRAAHVRGTFPWRAFEGAPRIGRCKPTWLVLDGQQRLTSLYQAFFGVGEGCWFISLGKLMKRADFGEALLYCPAYAVWPAKAKRYPWPDRDPVFPFGAFRGDARRFLQWSRRVTRRLSKKEGIDLEDRLIQTAKGWIDAIDGYQLPVIDHSGRAAEEALGAIFEALNRRDVGSRTFEPTAVRLGYWRSET